MKKTFFASLILSVMSFSAIAQSQLIPTPASSTGGSGVAVVAITPVSLPTDVCTSTNNNCYNSGTNPPPISAVKKGDYCGYGEELKSGLLPTLPNTIVRCGNTTGPVFSCPTGYTRVSLGITATVYDPDQAGQTNQMIERFVCVAN